ncbi:MAG: phage capsid protein [Nanoarchaeota archaeon]
MSNLINGSIDQSLIQSWENNFYTLSQQKQSFFDQSKAIKRVSFNSLYHNVARMDKTSLNRATGRNPDVQLDEAVMDNRRMKKYSFHKQFIFDKKDIREAMADPTSEVYMQLMAAFNREKDKFIAETALGSVEVGDSNNGGTSTISAAADGVNTIDATSGLDYPKVKRIITNFINRNVATGTMQNTDITLAVAGTDWDQLLNEDKFINNNYSSYHPIDKGGYLPKLFGMDLITFAGNDTGVITDADITLKEDGSIRSCLALAPQSIYFDVGNVGFRYIPELESKVRSSGLYFYCEMAAMRSEGVKVQEIRTTF